MLRYRCSHCSQILQAHELRAGKKSVCNVCLASHIIPSDRSEWLNEVGEPLVPRAAVTTDTPQPSPGLSQSSAYAPEPVGAAAPASVPEPVAVAVETPLSEPEPPMTDPRSTPATATPVARPTPHVRMSPPPLPAAPEQPRRSGPRPVQESGIALGAPVHVDTQADIAAAITTALSQRMKPRRRPRRDLRLSTALWLLCTGIGIACVLVTLFTTIDASVAALVFGALQVVFGYVWIVAMAARREAARGVACAVPPLTLYFLAQWKYGRYRPLRFVLTGAAIAATGYFASSVAETTRAWAGIETPTPVGPVTARPDPAKLQQLRDFRDQKSFDKLIELLRVLAQTDAILSEDARNRAELASEMKALCTHADTGVKVAALAGYVRWGGDEASEVCLKALGGTEEEQLMALRLLPKWKDTPLASTVARAVAALVGRPGRVTSQAARALEEISGSAAEAATLDLLRRSREQNAQLVALDVLEKVGGPSTLKELEGYYNTLLDQSIKTKARSTMDVLKSRPLKP